MFTGIIEELGKVTALRKDDVSMEITFQLQQNFI